MDNENQKFGSVQNEDGNHLFAQGDNQAALQAYQRAAVLLPNTPEIQLNIGNALKRLGQLPMAIQAYQRAIQLRPEYADAHFNLGTVYADRNEHLFAAATYQKALQIDPSCCEFAAALVHQLQHLCEWDGLTELSRRIAEAFASSESNPPTHFASPFCFITLPIPTTDLQQLRCIRTWATRIPTPTTPMYRIVGRPETRDNEAKIRLGYLSADFRKHAVAYMVAELFETHNRERFEVVGYSYGQDDRSPIRRRIVDAFDRFQDIRGDSHETAARKIAADGIDILVDLQGYTTGSRPELLALRPAPIQVGYLGFPATMGSSFIDYMFVDEFVVPVDKQPFFSEQLCHLPGCYQVNDRQHAISHTVPSRSECGLPDDGFVFCSFNNSHKLTRSMFRIWMRLLQSIPESVLWLPAWHPNMTANLRREAMSNGVDVRRLVFAPQVSIEEHLARHRLADLSLDTFPYNAHATASISLRMAVPIVTLAGETFASRVAGSLLHAVGLPELITRSESEYEALVLRLATQPEVLAAIRQKLAANLVDCPLFDGRRFAKNVERAYQAMMQRYNAGLPPQPLRI